MSKPYDIPAALLAAQTTKHHPPKLSYSILEACTATSLSRTTIYKHIAAGRLRVTRIGGRTVIPTESLHALVGVGQ
jgi:excisionase family DNA binding protein